MDQIKFNDLTREYLEEFIAKLPKEDKRKLREYIENHPRNSSSGMFATVKSYIYNTYFRQTPSEAKSQKGTFADALEILLQDDEDNEE